MQHFKASGPAEPADPTAAQGSVVRSTCTYRATAACEFKGAPVCESSTLSVTLAGSREPSPCTAGTHPVHYTRVQYHKVPLFVQAKPHTPQGGHARRLIPSTYHQKDALVPCSRVTAAVVRSWSYMPLLATLRRTSSKRGSASAYYYEK
jgi:hypothetical protein